MLKHSFFCSCLEDPKFEHFKPVLDAYISGHFAAALVYKYELFESSDVILWCISLSLLYRGLLSCVRHCCELVPVTERQEPIQKCFKSLEYIAKFVIQSRHLFSRATGGHSEDSFVVDIHLVFNSVNKMMSSTNDTVLQVYDIKISLFAAAYN